MMSLNRFTILRKSFPALAAIFLTAILFSGCSHYQLGRDAKPPFRSIYIKPAVNESFAPQAQALLTMQIRDALIRDGLLQIHDESEADAILEVTLKTFDRRVAATRTDDTGLAEKLRLELAAHCTLADNRTGKIYFKNRPVSATSDAFPQDSSAGAEFQSMPVLTDRLARRIAYEVLQVW